MLTAAIISDHGGTKISKHRDTVVAPWHMELSSNLMCGHVQGCNYSLSVHHNCLVWPALLWLECQDVVHLCLIAKCVVVWYFNHRLCFVGVMCDDGNIQCHRHQLKFFCCIHNMNANKKPEVLFLLLQWFSWRQILGWSSRLSASYCWWGLILLYIPSHKWKLLGDDGDGLHSLSWFKSYNNYERFK